MSLIRPNDNNSIKNSKLDEKRNMSSFTVKSDQLIDNFNEEQIYRQYKNNMLNAINNKQPNQPTNSKRAEPENQILDICIPVR